MTLAARLAGKTAAETISIMLAVFGQINPALRKSITFDNEPPSPRSLLRTMRDMTTWFSDAYASWQKGGSKSQRPFTALVAASLDIDKCPTKKSRTSSSPPISRRENALALNSFQAILEDLGKDVQIRFT